MFMAVFYLRKFYVFFGVFGIMLSCVVYFVMAIVQMKKLFKLFKWLVLFVGIILLLVACYCVLIWIVKEMDKMKGVWFIDVGIMGLIYSILLDEILYYIFKLDYD